MPSVPRSYFSLFSLCLISIFTIGIGLRLVDLSAPLLDFHPARQLFAAIRARGLYYQTLPDAPAWQKDLATRQLDNTAVIEPPVMEHLAVFFYGYFGEQTAIPRAFSVIFWSLGAIFLFLLTCNLTGSSSGAAAALAVYMFIPYALRASRSFQPDPLMILLILIFWWAVERWGRTPMSWKWSLLAGVSGGLAIFVKFPAAFFVIGGGAGAVLAYPGIRRALKLPQTWVMALVGILPAGLYLYYGLYVARFLGQQFEDRFYPDLLLSPNFYLRWFLKVDTVVGALALAFALMGWLLFANRPLRIFLSALFVSYFLFGVVFDYHIASHDYYSLPLIPIIALALAPLAADVLIRLQERLSGSRWLTACAVLVMLVTFGGLAAKGYLDLHLNDYRPQAEFWAKVGEAIGHQPGLIALTGDYGDPLKYYGWQNSDPWPVAPDDKNIASLFRVLAGRKSYFLITDFDEFNRQPKLRRFLQIHYPILMRGEGFMVYDLLHPLKKKSAAKPD